ncbi:pteridine reductase [Gammaproteobacteria bacterium 45_16_T64]|nr:pteridine reductase [Gammaproteobacteria bacterium 45_16_T64]
MTDTKVALITGASQRLGAATSRQLHQRGYNIVVHYRHSKKQAQALASELNAIRHHSCKCIQADLDQIPEVEILAQETLASWQRLDLLVNNASGFFSTPIGECTEQQWDNLFGSNSKAPLFLSQALAPALANTQGSIVNMIDIHANAPLNNHTLYCMAKSALKMMTLSLAKELAPNIRVNGVSPGAILWPKPEQEMTPQEKQHILSGIPLQRLGHLDDIASTVAFLASANYITGQIIAVDGGRSL